MWLLLALWACGDDPAKPGSSPDTTDTTTAVDDTTTTPTTPDTEEQPAVCDAGDAAWVQRVFPLLLGRRVEGAAEAAAWVEMVQRHGRAETVRALTRDPLYAGHWRRFLEDALKVSRSGNDNDAVCWETANLPTHDGSLATFVRDTAADAGTFGGAWNMADLTADALVLDDLSVLWRANVFARTNYVPYCGNNTGPEQIEGERRASLGDDFISTYTNRNLTCISCHNSEYSVTDDPDPALDRTWGEPALFERALFNDSWGPDDADTFYAIFRYNDVVFDSLLDAGQGSFPARPWGWDNACGSFHRQASPNDFLDIDAGYFAGPNDATMTLWDVEATLQSGVDSLGLDGLKIEPDRTVAPDQALAWLTARHLVDQVWANAFGTTLTLPYGFSRNQAQFERLTTLTQQFAQDGWSLRELLVGIATDPYFNAGLPATCGAAAYGLDPVVDPYSVDDPDVTLHGNGAGDLVHRQFARTLIESANYALGWGPPEEYFNFGGTDAEDLQNAIGVFHNSGEPGFNGIDFQGLLAWESTYGLCTSPFGGASDMVDEVVVAGAPLHATVEDAALTIKDRLVARGIWEDADEAADVEALLGVPLTTELGSLPVGSPVLRKLRLFCGLLTMSPEFMLAAEPRPLGPPPAIDIGSDVACERLATAWSIQGVTVSCVDGQPVE